MINKKRLIKRIIIIACLFLLIGCGLNNDEKKQIEEDKPLAISLAVSFIKEKYGIDVETKETYGVSKSVGKSKYYRGDIIVTLKEKEKIFYVWVNIEDKVCKDNYQTDQILEDTRDYLKQITNGDIIGINFKTHKGDNALTVLNKEVNNIFNTGAFFKDKYNKENFYEYISYVDMRIVMTDGVLNKLSEDIDKKTKSYKNNGTLFISDFKDTQAYELVKKEYEGSDEDINQYATLLDESLTHRYVKDEASYQETFSKSHHLYKKYEQKKIDNLVISYQEGNIVTIDNDADKIYSEIKAKANDKTQAEINKQTVKQYFKLSSQSNLVSFALCLDGRVEDDYDIYSFSDSDGKISYYTLTQNYFTNHMKTYLLFNEIVDDDVYILVVKK